MFIVVEHQITKPESFWEMIQKAEIPSHFKLHQSLTSEEGNKAVCLWEAGSKKEIEDFVEGGVGDFSNNTYFAVQPDNSMGLPIT